MEAIESLVQRLRSLERDLERLKTVESGTGGGGPGSDTTAIHDNVAAEISAIAEKATPVGDDLLIIEDSAAADAKKRLKISNLPAVGGPPTGAAGGDLSGTYPNPSVVDDSHNHTGATVSLGAAGGALGGTYPNPTLESLSNTVGEVLALARGQALL